MNQVDFKPLRESLDEIKDFRTIDLEKDIGESANEGKIKLTTNETEINNDVIDFAPRSIGSEEKNNYDTLKEPVLETLKRDLMSILYKAKYVLNPYIKDEDKLRQLRNWDLWGPLVLTILLAISLAYDNEDKGLLFVEVFVIFWLGGIVVTFNAQVLGAKISIFQILCLLGYCMFPLNVTAILFKFIIDLNVFLKIVVVLLACAWACYSSTGFMKALISEDKKYLVLYPVILFYLFISFFVLMNHKIEVKK